MQNRSDSSVQHYKKEIAQITLAQPKNIHSKQMIEDQLSFSKALSYMASRCTNFESTRFWILPKITLILLFPSTLHEFYNILGQNLEYTF